MDRSFWYKQTKENPLFPDLLWSRPEHRAQAGKLLIIGGNDHGFAAVADGYKEAVRTGVGTLRVLLPDSIQRSVKMVLEMADYAPSTPSGSFSRQALSELLGQAQWADGVLLAGDLGRNSETAVLLESFVRKYGNQLTITKDAVDYFTERPEPVISRQDTTLVVSLAQLQKIGLKSKQKKAITFDMDLLHLVDWLHEFTAQFSINLVVRHLDTIFVSVRGEVSTTRTTDATENTWRIRTAAHTAVWWLQNPTNTFQALTTAIIQ